MRNWKRKYMKTGIWVATIWIIAFGFISGCTTTRQTHSRALGSDIPAAVQAAAAKDCGCGNCAAKGCDPCHGKNCYYCAAKALVTSECGCGMCDAKGCSMCGPGCDVCKFHLAPVVEANQTGQTPKQ